uniref:HDC13014 n=1 Tax=Drosophila melanogaster TaxID=7227 RepID=Q6IKA1_DROME|nr:TPA_inf: HDC13014 [Drosophila melanogaster]
MENGQGDNLLMLFIHDGVQIFSRVHGYDLADPKDPDHYEMPHHRHRHHHQHQHPGNAQITQAAGWLGGWAAGRLKGSCLLHVLGLQEQLLLLLWILQPPPTAGHVNFRGLVK